MHTRGSLSLPELARARSITSSSSSPNRPRYFDYNATTPLLPCVIDTMSRVMKECWGNPSSLHSYGQEARKAVNTARQQVSTHLNCDADELVFLSGGTESINYALRGAAYAQQTHGRHLVTSVVEHPAVLETMRALERDDGFEVSYVPVNKYGMVEVDALQAVLRADTTVVSVMLANNEVGTINPIAELVAVARAVNPRVLFHTDASQAIGKIAVDVRRLGVDYLTLAGHKLYAPKGIGALYIRRDTPPLRKLMHGAHHEQGRRAGTENVIMMAGLGAACEWLSEQGHVAVSEHCRKMITLLKLELMEELKIRTHANLADVVRFNVHPTAEHGLPNTLSVSFRGHKAGTLMHAIMDYVACSAGAACNDECKPSYVLLAMGVPMEWAQGTLRLTVGVQTTADDCRLAAKAIVGALDLPPPS